MLHLGQSPADDDQIIDICLDRFALEAGESFRPHEHEYHQLTWSPNGVLAADVDGARWTLPSTVALWIPAWRRHTVGSLRAGEVHTLYFRVERCPREWPVVVIPMGGFLQALSNRLACTDLLHDQRAHLEAVMFDHLEPLGADHFELPLPDDPRAHDVARGLIDDPADQRTLGEWGRAVGASERTLSRRFRESCGVTFDDWRRHLRVNTAIGHLAAGTSVQHVARLVGYRDPSAFIEAFRRTTGSTPATHPATRRDPARFLAKFDRARRD